MYGTIARMKLKSGEEQAFQALLKEMEQRRPRGAMMDIVYRSDEDAHVFYLAAVFESKDSYVANAGSAEQHEEYLRLRALLEADPEWHDGEVVSLARWDGQGR